MPAIESSDLERMVRTEENAQTEFKKSLADIRAIIETIAAMATIGGGTILVGIASDGRVVGYQPGEGSRERLVQRVLGNTDPKIYVDLDEVELDGKVVLCIRVPPGDGPHLAFGRAFYRSGPATVAMTRDEYERRLMDRLRESGGFERLTEPDWTMETVDERAVAAFVSAARGRTRIETSTPLSVLDRLHLIRQQRVTVAGMLLFGRNPQRPLPQATIRARARRGASDDSAAIDGTLFEQIDRATQFVSRNLKLEVKRHAPVRQETPELPREAVREVIANAVAHRDYRSTAPIQLRLDDDGLVIWNPGHLPPPITPALLRQEHPSVPTNPLIARALFLAGYIEQWGTGTLRVVETMRDNGNPEPIFEDAAELAGIRVTLPMSGSLAFSLQPRHTMFLGRVEQGDRFRTSDYAEITGVAHRTALADLKVLESMGLVRREGKGKASRWIRT
jgi:ATP-dependent DNA helicase RecG